MNAGQPNDVCCRVVSDRTGRRNEDALCRFQLTQRVLVPGGSGGALDCDGDERDNSDDRYGQASAQGDSP